MFIMEKPKTVTIQFTKENLRHEFKRYDDCPIYHALNDAGLPVHRVFTDGWIDTRRGRHLFSDDLFAASMRLNKTSHLGFSYYVRCWFLKGRTFEVSTQEVLC